MRRSWLIVPLYDSKGTSLARLQTSSSHFRAYNPYYGHDVFLVRRLSTTIDMLIVVDLLSFAAAAASIQSGRGRGRNTILALSLAIIVHLVVKNSQIVHCHLENVGLLQFRGLALQLLWVVDRRPLRIPVQFVSVLQQDLLQRVQRVVDAGTAFLLH